MLDISSKCFIYIDETNPDEVLVSEFSDEAAKGQIATFKDFIHAHKDELDALSIIYHQSYQNRKLTRTLINELYERLKCAGLHIEGLWNGLRTHTQQRTNKARKAPKKHTNKAYKSYPARAF